VPGVPVLAWCLAALVGRRAVWILGWLVAGLAIAAVAFSRVELGVHWTTDVIASIVFVACWLTAIAVVLGGRLRQPALIGDRAGGAEPLPRHDQTSFRANTRGQDAGCGYGPVRHC